MSGYGAVPPSMFDQVFASLSRDGQALEFYIRTCPERSGEGLFRFRWGAVEDDLGITRDAAKAALKELVAAGRPFVYDPATQLILDVDAIRTQPIGAKDFDPDTWDRASKRDLRLKGAISRLKGLPKSRPLLKGLYVVALDCAPEFAAVLAEEFPEITEPLAPSDAPSKPLTKGQVQVKCSEEELSAEVPAEEIDELIPGSTVVDNPDNPDNPDDLRGEEAFVASWNEGLR